MSYRLQKLYVKDNYFILKMNMHLVYPRAMRPIVVHWGLLFKSRHKNHIMWLLILNSDTRTPRSNKIFIYLTNILCITWLIMINVVCIIPWITSNLIMKIDE